MSVTVACYCTREMVTRALDIKLTARSYDQVDRSIESSKRAVEGLLKWRLHPTQATRHFDWPNYQYARPWRLWLNQHRLISVDTLSIAGVAVAATDFFLEPDDGPPFTRVELDLDSDAAFGGGGTHQRNIAIEGLYGWRNDTVSAGQLDGAVDASTTTVDVSDSAAVGVGDLIQVGTERMVISDNVMLDTGQDLQAGLTAQTSSVSVAVADGTAFAVGEVLLVNSERMLVVDIAGNTLTVKRAWDGTVLASHSTGAGINAPRRLTVIRSANGTTAAAHSLADPVLRWNGPPLVRELGVAEAINTIQQEQSAYARAVGSGDNEREVSGRGLRDIRAQAFAEYGRKARIRAI